jgi:beta-glucosidase
MGLIICKLKMKKRLSAFAVLLYITVFSIFVYSQPKNELPQLGISPVKKVIAAMTLEEKASLVVGGGMNLPEDFKKKPMLAHLSPKPGTLADKTKNPVPSAVGNTIEIPRLGITCMVVNDGPAGLRMMGKEKNYTCTAYPIGTLLASTWDKDLIYKVGQSYGNDVLEYGVDVLLAPGLNIHRNPLCGRNFEYYSEDPFVSGKIASAMVRGVQSQGVGTSIKHFAANNQETDREHVNTIVSERALREIYLEGFRIAVQESHPWTVMTSYNLLNGLYTSQSSDLLMKVLRSDWQYKGLIMSDWMAGNDPVAQMRAGNDLIMPGPNQVSVIMRAVKEGKLDEKILDRNIENILNLVLKTPRFKNYKYSDKPNATANAEMSRKAATEGMVLLKNDNNTLPLAKEIKSVALFGNTSYQVYKGGTGSGYVAANYTIDLIDGIKNAGYVTHESLQETYKAYMKANIPAPKKSDWLAEATGGKKRAPEMPLDASLVQKMAETSDVALMTIGRNAGESQDRKVENDFNLSETEKTNLNTVSDAFHARGKKVVVILNIGGVIETASWRNAPDAILLAWQPGQEAGNAIADLISGKVNPSGKLASTFPMSYSDVPSAKNFPGVDVLNDSVISRKVVYEEGIYVGYRYYNTFDVKTAYEFGYGLSYTNFTYSNLKLSATSFKDKIKVTVDVKNNGKIAGKEVVQLYLSAPAKRLDKPESELKGFEKTKLLLPGESQTISFVLTSRELTSFNIFISSWDAEAGTYTVKIGASSKDIRLKNSFTLNKNLTVKKESVALKPTEKINELKP